MEQDRVFFRKIVKNGLSRNIFSLNLPLEFIQKLQLENTMTEIKIENNSIIIRKVGETAQKVTKTEEKSEEPTSEPYDYGDSKF